VATLGLTEYAAPALKQKKLRPSQTWEANTYHNGPLSYTDGGRIKLSKLSLSN